MISSSYPTHEGDYAGHFVQAEVDALLAQGHRVLVMTPGTAAQQATSHNIHITLGGTALFRSPGAWPNLKRNPRLVTEFFRASTQAANWALGARIRARLARFYRHHPHFEADRIVAHWLIPAAIPWGLFAHRAGIPFEVVVHGSDLQLLLRLPTSLLTLFFRQLYLRKAQLRFVSEALKRTLLTRSLPPELKRWLDSAEVRPAQLDLSAAISRSEARDSLKLTSEDRVLVVIGRLISQKRIAVALQAASLVPDACIFVVGDGPLRQELAVRFSEVTFLGALPRATTLRWIAAADLLLNASRLEGAPTAIREALALGTEVVSTEVADLKSWALEGSGLWLVP